LLLQAGGEISAALVTLSYTQCSVSSSAYALSLSCACTLSNFIFLFRAWVVKPECCKMYCLVQEGSHEVDGGLDCASCYPGTYADSEGLSDWFHAFHPSPCHSIHCYFVSNLLRLAEQFGCVVVVCRVIQANTVIAV
jgi:hypothetical protein